MIFSVDLRYLLFSVFFFFNKFSFYDAGGIVQALYISGISLSDEFHSSCVTFEVLQVCILLFRKLVLGYIL